MAPAELEGKNMKISTFSRGCRSFPITSQQLHLSPTLDPALPASILTGLIQSGLSQHQQSAFFRDLGREKYEGKKKWQRKRLQMDARLGKEK